jgi:hypothetical protein
MITPERMKGGRKKMIKSEKGKIWKHVEGE